MVLLRGERWWKNPRGPLEILAPSMLYLSPKCASAGREGGAWGCQMSPIFAKQEGIFFVECAPCGLRVSKVFLVG